MKAEPATGPSRIAAIVSTASGHGADATHRSLLAHVRGDVDVRLVPAGSPRDAIDTARELAAWADVVVAVGGDGTVSAVATGILGSSAALGIIPAGSTNIVARSLGIPTHPEAAVALLAGPHVLRPIDVGRSGDRCFLHMAGAGFDAEIFRLTDQAWKRRVGWLAYLPAATAALRIEPSRVRVTVDGLHDETQSPLVLVANGGSAIAPAFKIYPDIAPDDGWLDVLIFTATTPAHIAATLGLAGRQRLDRSSHVIRRRGSKVRIDAEPPMSVELDGDVIGTTPRDFHVVPLGLKVVTPLA